MDFLINRCLIALISIQLSLLGDAYVVDRKVTGYLDKETSNEGEDNSDVDIAEQKRYIYEDGKELQQEKRAREAVNEEIKELLNTLKVANRMNSNGINDMHREQKRGWWTGFCARCGGSKLEAGFISGNIAGNIAGNIGCTCKTGIKSKCKCPDGKVHDGN